MKSWKLMAIVNKKITSQIQYRILLSIILNFVTPLSISQTKVQPYLVGKTGSGGRGSNWQLPVGLEKKYAYERSCPRFAVVLWKSSINLQNALTYLKSQFYLVQALQLLDVRYQSTTVFLPYLFIII